jgi:uncharacterized protein YggE
MIRRFAVAATLAAPLVVAAQPAMAQAARPPVTVEIVASGQVVVPANRFRMSVKLSAKGADEQAAAAALAAARTRLTAALASAGVREAEPFAGETTSIATLFASMAGRSKPSFTTDLTSFDTSGDGGTDGGDVDKAPPETTASETVMFDAPSRAAVASASRIASDAGATVEAEVIALLDDYVGPTRRAKAEALKKAQAEADAYAAALQLRTATVTRISERQDIVAGSMSFVTQLIGMFAPKPPTGADTVPVQTSLTVEFTLTR